MQENLRKHLKGRAWLAGVWMLLAVLFFNAAGTVSAAEMSAAAVNTDIVISDEANSPTWKWQGKAPLSDEKVQEILAIPKGERPDPSTYLDKKYIRKHLKRFRKGISLVMGQDSYVMYVIARKHVGREDNSCFVMPKSVCDDIAKAANGNLAVYEEALGFPPGYFYGHGGLVRMDVVEVEDLHLRLPSGNEAGANSYWLPGGYTSGGVPEAVTDLIPKSRLMVTLLPSPQDGSCP